MSTKRIPEARQAKHSAALAKIRPVVLRIAKKHGATNVRIFGSFARGEERKNSDIDLLIDPPAHMSLLDLSGLKIDLEDALKRKVDVVPERSIKPILRDSILADARPL
ncbi:hypothetical protein A3C37_04195 [Candidatus Peribacteria bacterium RIFCSPHIGHO2_02_FULL_53_20]|nr:MAG: hypothetical protein A3C37_04195 [Candidatus Peribacteria bacterium RIFCSPHIGHO2_02_FULL_53_20]OGJ66955.1 MAG: hypothetical protein A3B61_03050 [Candidatus Peribacteria bacterium RIFCSPLOWO2_01_FULL_53_10]